MIGNSGHDKKENLLKNEQKYNQIYRKIYRKVRAAKSVWLVKQSKAAEELYAKLHTISSTSI